MFDQSGVLAELSGGSWSMGADGVLTAIIIDQGSVKRVRITPGNDTSIDTMLAKAR